MVHVTAGGHRLRLNGIMQYGEYNVCWMISIKLLRASNLASGKNALKLRPKSRSHALRAGCWYGYFYEFHHVGRSRPRFRNDHF